MKEKERLIIVEQIKKDIEEKENLPKKEMELQSLLENEFVKKYLEIKNQIESLKNCAFNKTKDDIIYFRFVRAMIGTDHYDGVSLCDHSMFLYLRSERFWADDRCEHDCYVSCADENDPDFKYNVYRCMECCRDMKVENWKDFERRNFVLKDYNNNYPYWNRYHHLLCEMSVDDARDTVIEEFNKQKKIGTKK